MPRMTGELLFPCQTITFARESPLGETLCQIYPVVYYTVQGASLFSLTVVTINRAAILFLPQMAPKVA